MSNPVVSLTWTDSIVTSDIDADPTYCGSLIYSFESVIDGVPSPLDTSIFTANTQSLDVYTDQDSEVKIHKLRVSVCNLKACDEDAYP